MSTSRLTEPKQQCYFYARFSTSEQEKGDSLRRQKDAALKYAKEHDLDLDESRMFIDDGVSAFKGKNRTHGKLGEFLSLVQKGHVRSGSILLVESLDRLSREEPMAALSRLYDVTKRGILIYALHDSKMFSNEHFGIDTAISAILIMYRANEESKTKSKRVGEAWQEKRVNAKDKKLTRKCPAWLRPSEIVKEVSDLKSFTGIDERCYVVRRIFDLYLGGKGIESIARELNEDKNIEWKPTGRILKKSKERQGGGWRKSYVSKILRNREVIGEFQPCKKIDGKRVADGDPISDYFPTIVDKEVFNATQERFRRNSDLAGNGGGRNGKISNLFGHLAKCGYCGGSMRFIDKGKSPKGGSYLVCDNAARKIRCERYSIKYPQFENMIIKYCKGLNPQNILPSTAESNSELQNLQIKLNSIKGDIAEKRKEKDRLRITLRKDISDRFRSEVEADYEALIVEIEKREKDRQEIERSLMIQQQAYQNTRKHLDELSKLDDAMTSLSGQDRISLRERLRSELQRLITKINIYPRGKITVSYNTLTKAQRERLLQPEKAELHIYFDGGSYKTLTMNGILTDDYDSDKGRLLSISKGGDVDVVYDVDIENELEGRTAEDKTVIRINKRIKKKLNCI